ncbi:uncharacterized protein [Ptychodera flava]|uniref:uncharacterized protein n=1 Tax=Ptychodera flava TaxID=63121 RepID=UPI00396A31DA
MPNMKVVTALILFILVTICEYVAGDVPIGDPPFVCDDGRTNLKIDWDGDVDDYHCLESHYWSSQRKDSIEWTEKLENFEAMPATEVCMNSSIVYEDPIPTSGAHRPLWPVYGEYTYLPPQRWVHSLKLGAIVALYHPCTDPAEVETLRSVVRGCLRRHIISPSKELTEDLPVALVTWTWKVFLPYAYEGDMKDFIKTYALTAPEAHKYSDGQFKKFLKAKAAMVTNERDEVLCPEE